MERFQKLKVWQRAHQLTLAIYQVTAAFPRDERFGLVAQMRRAAQSVPSNIAEGTERSSVRDRKHFHEMARTSLEEVKYDVLLSMDLGYLPQDAGGQLLGMAQEVGKMLRGLDRSL